MSTESSSSREITVFENINTNNKEALNNLETRIAQELHSVNRPIFVFVVGLPASGKSKFTDGWVTRLERKFEKGNLSKEFDSIPKIYRADFREVISFCRNIAARERDASKPRKFILGETTKEEYEYLAGIEGKYRSLILTHLDRGSIVVYETPLLTQTFDKNGVSIGVSRGNIDDMKALARDIITFHVFIIRDEESRIKSGSIRSDDFFNPEKDTWMKINEQYYTAILGLLDTLMAQNAIADRDLLDLYKNTDRGEMESKMRIVQKFLEKDSYYRIAHNIYGSLVNERIFILKNPEPRNNLNIINAQEHSKDRLVVKALKEKAKKDSELKKELFDLGVED